MTFYMFKGIAAKLFISTQMVTTLIFPSGIEKVIVGWNKGDVFKYKSKDKKVLVLRSNIKKINSNMTVITNSGVYDFMVRFDQNKPHVGSVEIKNGGVSTSYKLLVENKDYDILEGEYTVLVNPKKKLTINDKSSNEKTILPKGHPLFIDGRRVLF